MKIPIWLTVKNIYKTIFSNLLSFISLPTIVLLSLPYVLGLNVLSLILLIIFPLLIYPLLSASMQKYLLTRDNQLAFNKLQPKFDQKQRRYILFYLYVIFYIYLVPLLLTPLLLLTFKDLYIKTLTISQSNMTIAILGIIILLLVITYARGLKCSISASMVHSYISIHNTRLKFKQLIEVSSTTLMGNKWQIFFITFIPIIIVIIFSFLIRVFQVMFYENLEISLIYHSKTISRVYLMLNIIIDYLHILTYASTNVHIYLFFKDQFEENLAKISQTTTNSKIEGHRSTENI